ncbi:MAG: MazG-like family protein, partial [Alicyclobacillus sp.]|nr:MazG-like family protein [Alicyclobacillus sp.]
MPQSDSHAWVARRLRTIEQTKVDLLQHVCNVYRCVQHANDREVTEALGAVVAAAYTLASEYGLDLSAVDRAARA